jgi:outer membrane protein assembly factor BamB
MKRSLFAALLMLPAAMVSADWPQFQNTPGNTGFAPGVYVTPSTMDTVLKFDLGSAILAAPIVMGDTVYAAKETGVLYAINFKTGHVAWTFTDPAGIVSTPAADGKKVYVAARSGKVYGLDRMTGIEAWHFDADDTTALFKEFQAPLKLAGSRLYAGCFNGRLYCLDTAGNRQWDYKTYFYIKEGVAVKDSLIVLSSRDEMIYGLVDQGGTCRLLWQVNPGYCMAYTDPGNCNSFGCVALSRSTPALADTVFFLNFIESDGNYWTAAYSANSGALLKTYGDYLLNNTGFAVSGQGVVFCNGGYYATNPLGATGSWWAPRPGPDPVPGYCLQRAGEGPPIVIGNYAVEINAFNPTGLHFRDPVSRAYGGGLLMQGYNISSSLAASDSVLFFGTFEGVLFGMGHGGSVYGTGNAEQSLLQSSIDPPNVSPNPFNPSTCIRFSLGKAGKAEFQIFNSRGQRVFALERNFAAGRNEIQWNAKDSGNRPLPDGLYFLRFRMAAKNTILKLTLLK